MVFFHIYKILKLLVTEAVYVYIVCVASYLLHVNYWFIVYFYKRYK